MWAGGTQNLLRDLVVAPFAGTFPADSGCVGVPSTPWCLNFDLNCLDLCGAGDLGGGADNDTLGTVLHAILLETIAELLRLGAEPSLHFDPNSSLNVAGTVGFASDQAEGGVRLVIPLEPSRLSSTSSVDIDRHCIIGSSYPR